MPVTKPAKRMPPMKRADAQRRMVNLGSVLVRKGVPSKLAAKIIFERYGIHLQAKDVNDITWNHFWRGEKLGRFKGLNKDAAYALRKKLNVRPANLSPKNRDEIVGGSIILPKVPKKIISQTKRKSTKKQLDRQIKKIRTDKRLSDVAKFRQENPKTLFSNVATEMDRLWRTPQIREFFTTYSIPAIKKMMKIILGRLPEEERYVITGEFIYNMSDVGVSRNYRIKMNEIPALRQKGLINIALRIMRDTPSRKLPNNPNGPTQTVLKK